MSDQTPGRSPDRLDLAIDQAVRRLIDRNPPADLRKRVLARLSEPARARWAWTPWRLALAGAAVAVALAVVTVVPRWRERTTTPRLESQAAGGAIPASTPPERQRTSGAQIAAPPTPTRQVPTRPRGPSQSVEVGAASAQADFLLTIDPLPATDPIGIESLEPERVALLSLDISPLQFETIQFEPTQVPY